RRAPAALERAERRHDARRTSTSASHRGRLLVSRVASAASRQARNNRHVASEWTQPGIIRRLRPFGPLLRRQLVTPHRLGHCCTHAAYCSSAAGGLLIQAGAGAVGPTQERKCDSAIVFGGAGFVGSHLIRELAAGGAREIVCADLESPRTRLDGVRYVQCDVRSPIDVDGHFDVAFNLAAVHRTPGHADHEYFETNVEGARNVTDFCRRRDVSEIVFTSSISVYGPNEERLTEASELQPV